MFGLSLAELLVVLIVAVLVIKPRDLPEIARFLGRTYYRAKKLFNDLKTYLKETQTELGLDDLKHELHNGIASEKSKLEDDFTIIVDINGNEHKVPNIKNIRPDLSDDEISSEVENLNQNNSKTTNSNRTPSQ